MPPIPIDDIEAARKRVADVAIRTPLVRLHVPDVPAEAEIWLKLECLQSIGAFKIRGAANAIRSAPPDAIRHGVWTTSAGNMAQGVAWIAREEGVPATIVVPDHAPDAKVVAIERLGGTVIKVPFERWWQAMLEGSYPGVEGFFVHPVMHHAVMAGNGTIGLEVLEDLAALGGHRDIDAVLVPWGGGGLFTGIASAIKARSPQTKMYSCEPATGAPMHASFAAGEPTAIDYTASFVDGAGGKSLLPPMWDLARPLLDGTFAPSLDETAAAIRLLISRARVVAEGAGALSVAAAMSGDVIAPGSRIVCIVSGGNIDAAKLATILQGQTPRGRLPGASISVRDTPGAAPRRPTGRRRSPTARPGRSAARSRVTRSPAPGWRSARPRASPRRTR
jgi:threonine dehydratase